MSNYAFEILDFQDPDALANAAADLIVREIYGRFDQPISYTDGKDYIREADPEIDTHYALTTTDTGLVAAAGVLHGIDGLTEVCDFAVDPANRGQGYGRNLMRHIAEHSLEQGDTVMSLVPLEPFYFSNLGFAYDGEDHLHMYADPLDLI